MRSWFLLLLPSCLALRTLEPPPPVSSTRNNPVEGWVNVRLNHFDASNTDTFDMFYYYNNEFEGENIIIFVGGEWSISPGWVSGGLAHELAEKVGAGIFYTEHRYYGITRPSADTSTTDLRFLTVDQALADLAQFIEYVKSDDFEEGRYKNGKVGLVGCSYAGSMATWMRLAYPHVVDAAFSDSGPLHAQEDFPEYLELITEALRSQGSEQCVSSVESAMTQLDTLLGQNNGPAQVSELFNTCTTILSSEPMDLATFYWFGITETFAYLVQYASPGDIAQVCDALTDTNVSLDPLVRLASWITSQSWTQPCIETRYTEVVAAHTNTSYDAPDSVMRLWTYQTCVEFGWYQTTSSSNQPFLNAVPLEYFHQMCKDFFGIYFDESILAFGVERTNTLFAGVTYLPDFTVSVAGGHDPWSPMGPNEGHGRLLAPVFVVPTVSHCRAIYSTASSETTELATAKENVLNYMSAWMTGEILSTDSAAKITATSVLVLGVLIAVI